MTNWSSFRPPETYHPFALSLSSDEWVIVSGIGGHDEHGEISPDVREQTRVALSGVKGLLERAGSSLSEIVYLKPNVTEREYAAEMDEVIQEFLPGPMPAVGALTVVGLVDPRMKVEIEVWANRGATIT